MNTTDGKLYWRTLADDEILQDGDRYTYFYAPGTEESECPGIPVWPQMHGEKPVFPARSCIGKTAGACRAAFKASVADTCTLHYQILRKL